jgi:hypothetical protein
MGNRHYLLETDVFTGFFRYRGLDIGIAESRGRRMEMEDAVSVQVTPGLVYLGLFDGHGGNLVSTRAAAHLLPIT